MRISLNEALLQAEKTKKKGSSALADENPFMVELRKLQALESILRTETLARLQSPPTQTSTESLTNTAYQVITKPDGSRVLVITIQMDGETFVRSIKLTDSDGSAATMDAADVLLGDGLSTH